MEDLKELDQRFAGREAGPVQTPGGREPSPRARLQTGNLLFLEPEVDEAVEWLLLERDEAAGRALVVPASSLAWVGSADTPTWDQVHGRTLVVSCDLGLWLSELALVGRAPTGSLAPEDLERARACRLELPEPVPLGGPVPGRVEEDPAYLHWRRTLRARRDRLCRDLGGEVDRVVAEVPLPVRWVVGKRRSAAGAWLVLILALFMAFGLGFVLGARFGGWGAF